METASASVTALALLVACVCPATAADFSFNRAGGR